MDSEMADWMAVGTAVMKVGKLELLKECFVV